MMGISLIYFCASVKRSWHVLCLALLFNIRLCGGDCLSTEAHLHCFSQDWVKLTAFCQSSTSASNTHCAHIFPKKTQLAVPNEWISARSVGAWYQVAFSIPVTMTKVIIQQRSAEFSQIKKLSIEFKTGPSLEITLTRNINESEIPVFDQNSFSSRSSENIKFTVLSMHTVDYGYPGFRSVQIYDENCDRNFQEMNIEHRSLRTNPTLVRSWRPFTGALKMSLTFQGVLTFYVASEPSVLSKSYKIIIDTHANYLYLYRVEDGAPTLMESRFFYDGYDLAKRLFWFSLKNSEWKIGYRAGVVVNVPDTIPLNVKYWGIACSSLEPVRLTYWKHIGKCYEKADYYWLMDKLLGGSTIAELRQGKDGYIYDINEAKVLPYGPHVDGHISSALFLTGANSGGVHLGKFHKGCFSDITTCDSGFTVALWVSLLDASETSLTKKVFRISNNFLSLTYRTEVGDVKIKTDAKKFTAQILLGRAYWNHIFILWHPVQGLKVLVNNMDEYTGSVSSVNRPASPGYTSFDVGKRLEHLDQNARMAIRDIALWHRRLSLVEAREYYRCNNFEIPREFLANRREAFDVSGALPFHGTNMASPKYGGSCITSSPSFLSCDRAIDGVRHTEFKSFQKYVSMVVKFDQVYRVNRVIFIGSNHVTTLALKFSDGTSKKFKVVQNKVQEIIFEDKSTDSIEFEVEGVGTSTGIKEVRVYYDFFRDRLPSADINWAFGCHVNQSGSTLLDPYLTDGLTFDDKDQVIAVDTTAAVADSASSVVAGPPSVMNSSDLSSKWIHIKLTRKVKVNLLRLWLADDVTSYDHLKRFKLEFSIGHKIEFRLLVPDSSTNNTYWGEFVFEPCETDWIHLRFLKTHETQNGKIGIKEVELFYDTSKDLPASKTIIDAQSVRTWEEGLSAAKFGAFDFLLNVDLKTTQTGMYVLVRRTDLGTWRTVMRTNSDDTLFLRVGKSGIHSKSLVVDGEWHNIKLFYNARESLLSLFIDNRLDSTVISLVPEEPDGWDWVEGETLDSRFNGALKNFRIHQAVQGFGLETKKILDSALSATSVLNISTGADKARLNGQGAWMAAANDNNAYLQVDLGIASHIVYIAFQGFDNMWVTWARISYSIDSLDWVFPLDINNEAQIFRASNDSESVAMVMLYSPVVARYIRVHPHLSNVGKALRTEIYNLDYGLPFNLMLAKHVPSYQGCVNREELFKLKIFFPLSFKSLASTPEDCKHACSLQGYTLAGLFQGVVCYCVHKSMYLKKLQDVHCSYPCPGNPVFRCGGETAVSLYEAPPGPLCGHCTVGIYSDPLISMLRVSELFTNSSGDAVSFIDISLNGVHFSNLTSGIIKHRFITPGQMHLVAEARDALGRQVAVASRNINVQHKVQYAALSCPEWVLKGEMYWCELTVQRGTATNVDCTINGEYLPLELDGNMFVTTGDITPGFPATTLVDLSSSTVILPAQVVLTQGVLVSFEFATTGPGRVTVQVFRPSCEEGKVYCQTSLSCVNKTKDCQGSNYPTTARTFPSTEKICNALDAYCPTRRFPSNFTNVALAFEQSFQAANGGVHIFFVYKQITLLPGDYIGYTNTAILQHKSPGVSFRAEEISPGVFSPVLRVEDHTALVRAHYWKYRTLDFDMNKGGELNCLFSNEIAKNSAVVSDYINVYEEVKDVVLSFPNVTATNLSVQFVVDPHPGGDVSYTFYFSKNKSVVLENRDSGQTLILNYTFTNSGHFLVNLTVENAKSVYHVSAWILVLDPIVGLALPCPLYIRVGEMTNISMSAKFGDDLTLNVNFGDGHSATLGPLDFGSGIENGAPHIYETLGTYNVSIVAENAISVASLTGLVIVMEPVCNASVSFENEVAFIEEPVTLLASASKGKDVQYLIKFDCIEKEIYLPEEKFVSDELTTSFTKPCTYDFYLLAYNNVSYEIYNGSLVVEDAAIVNLRATVGLSVAGEPTVFTATYDSGVVVSCTWDFGGSVMTTLPSGEPVVHVYPTGGKYVVNMNCSNRLKSANTSLDIEVLVFITQLDITIPGLGYGPGKNVYPLEDPLKFNCATDGIFVNFTVNFGDATKPVVTKDTSIEHVFLSSGSYVVTVNVSNAISYKIATISVTLLESVKDIAIKTNGPLKLGEMMIFEVTMGQRGTSACYYIHLGDGTEFVYKVDWLTTCTADYKHVTDIRVMTSKAPKISFTHTYTNLSVYHVTCAGSNLVSSADAITQAVIVEAPCSSPEVSIEGLKQSVDDSREFMRSVEFEITSKNTIDCDATSETDFEWKVFKVTPAGFSAEESVEISLPDIKTDDWKVVFKPRSLDYGLYYISFTLSMVGVDGVFSSTFGYIRIIPSPIVAEVRGGSTRFLGFNKVILLDGGVSRDPDVEEGDYEGMYFYWYCKRNDDNYAFPAEPEAIKPPVRRNTTNSTQFVDFGGCFGHGPGRLNHSNTTFSIDMDTGLMRENMSYTVQLLVQKDSRRSVFNLFMEIIPGDPPTVALTCLMNCLVKFNPTVKVSLEVTCQDCRNSDNMNYRWEVYLNTEGSWVMLENLDDVILTRPSSPNFVIKEESLLGNRTYKIRANVWRPGGIAGVAELVRTVNIPPFGGRCSANPLTGFALDTLYGITCGDWIDDNLPLKYTFSYFPGKGTLESLFYVGENSFSPNVTFPTGQEENHTLHFVVLVTDSLEASTLVELVVQVKPTGTDTLKSKVDDLTSANGTLGTLLSSGDTQNALQMISAVGNMLNFESAKDESADSPGSNTGSPRGERNGTSSREAKKEVKDENTKVRTSLVRVISTAPVETLEDAHRTSSVLGTVTKETGEVSKEAQDTATSTLETVGDVLESAAEKPGTHPRTVAKTAEAVLSGLGNVIQAAFFVEQPAIQEPKFEEKKESSDDSQKSETAATESPTVDTEEEEELSQEKERKKELANKLMTVVKKVAKAVTTSKAPGEQPTRIDTPYLSLEVYRENPDELSEKVLTAGSGSFALPQMGSVLNGSGIVDVSTVATPTNPFEDEFNRIHSVVMTTEIRNASGGLSISNLDDTIDIRLPRQPNPVPSRRLYQAIAGKMVFHKFDVTHNDSSINIDLHLVGNCSERANFSLFLEKDRKPSVLEHTFNITIPDYESDTGYNESKGPNTFFISNVDLKRVAAGRFYVGLIYNRPDVECPQFMNYTVDFFTSGCLYWDEEVNVWKGDGCTVGFLTNRNETHCLCNHLTSFGGDFMVPPNSIDWDAVSMGFANVDENPLVFAVVVSIIALYFFLLVWVRRLDKKDLEEFITIPLPDNDPRDNYNYEVVVYTGHSNSCGTTAKVFIILSGNRDETEPRALLDSTNTALKPGGVDTFLLSVPSSLGKLDHVRIWHDNTGDSPSWYVNRILVRDVQSDKKTWFLCDQWLAVEEDDGLIHRVLLAATRDDLISFNFLFSIEARRKMFDEHLWFSVLARRPRNQFSRVQRLSCCLAVLLSTMLANAMFYQIDDSTSSGSSVRAGPLVFSLKQLWIGFISCLVILPVNLLIVYIFRNVQPRDLGDSNDGDKNSGNAQKYAVSEETEAKIFSDPTENLATCSKTSLPRKFMYVAYVLLFLTISVSATFTIFYGFTFGKEKSEKWISSTMLSFFQDLMLLQPLKVFFAATFIALIIKDPNKVDQGDKNEGKREVLEQVDEQLAGDEEQLLVKEDNSQEPGTPRMVAKPVAESQLVAVRELRTKQKIMRRIISEICWYIAYLVLISIVAYGNRDPKAYLVTKTMNDMFVENKYSSRMQLNDVSSISQYWSWLYNSILPAINPPFWYGPYGLDDIETISKTMASKSRAKAKSKSSKTKSSGSSDSDDLEAIYHAYPKHYTADRAVSYIVGLVRTRQLRNAPQDSCLVHPTVRHLQRQCSQEYSWSNEDESCYNVSWSTHNGSKESCQQMTRGKSQWTYRTAWDLKGTPFWGKFHNYWGGGYVWNFDSSLSVVQKESRALQAQSWLDHQTRVVFLEFTIYNAFTNFFCSVTLLLEKQLTGAIHPFGQLHTLRLYHYVGAEAIVTLVCEIIFVGVLCYIFTRELKEARSRGIKNYFKDPWNYFDILGLVFSFTAIGLYFARMAATSLALKQINDDGNAFVSFHYVSAIDQSFTILLALAIFVYVLKVLRLLRFNRKIGLLSTTLIACRSTLIGFMLTYMLIFAAYAQIMYLVYGRDMAEYASYHRCLASLMEMTLGSSDFDGMNATNRVLTGFIFFSYTLLNMCVYMNLFISILSETFSTVRADVLLQPNDHEIVDFMIKTVKKTFFRAVEPVTNPIYKESKDDIDIGLEKITDTSECIQGSLQGLCKEDIRQALWFGDKSKIQEKRILFRILLESGEIFTENDIGDAVPLFKDILRKFTMDDLLVMQDNQRRKAASELAKSLRESSRGTGFSQQRLSASERCLSAKKGGDYDDDDGNGIEWDNSRYRGDRSGSDSDEGGCGYSDGRYSDRDIDDNCPKRDDDSCQGDVGDGGCHGDDGGHGDDDDIDDGCHDDDDGDNGCHGDDCCRGDDCYDDGCLRDDGDDSDDDHGIDDGGNDHAASNLASLDADSDSDDNGNCSSDQFHDADNNSDTENSGKRSNCYEEHGSIEDYDSSTQLSPRANACVITMETDKYK